jgi:hypothetical protein
MRKLVIQAYLINRKSITFLRYWSNYIFTKMLDFNRKIYLHSLKNLRAIRNK